MIRQFKPICVHDVKFMLQYTCSYKMQQNNTKIASARVKRSVHKMMKQNNKTKGQLRLEYQKSICKAVTKIKDVKLLECIYRMIKYYSER